MPLSQGQHGAPSGIRWRISTYPDGIEICSRSRGVICEPFDALDFPNGDIFGLFSGGRHPILCRRLGFYEKRSTAEIEPSSSENQV